MTDVSEFDEYSPIKVFAALLLIISFVEFGLTFLLHMAGLSSIPLLEALTDSILLTVLVAPVVYLLIIRPLRLSLKEMEKMGADLEVLNRVIRHDIRNDLNLILAWTSEMKEQLGDEEDSELVERVKKTSQHVIGLTKTARDFVESIEGGEAELDKVNASQVVKRSVEKAREAYTDAEINLHVEEGVEIEGTALFSSVVRNLVTNAVIHNDKEEAEAEVSLKEKDESALLEVADNGPGIPDNQKEVIFGKGEKGLESPGTGMGLYLVNSLVQSYGGEVWIEDNEPEGAVFKVTLPKYVGNG